MSIRTIKTAEEFQKIAKVLSHDVRMRIYELLHIKSHTIEEISEFLNLPSSTISVQMKNLEESDLITAENIFGKNGPEKRYSLKFDGLLFSMRSNLTSDIPHQIVPLTKEIEMPIGNYVAFEAKSDFGIVAGEKVINAPEELQSFFPPDHVKAQLIWLEKGYLEYNFPKDTPENAIIESLTFSAEMSSYTQGYNNDWPSDITVWINSVEIGTWTSPGDFGGIPGKYTPSWWPTTSSQYGILKTWKIDKCGTYIDNEKISDININDVALDNKPYICVKIGVKPDAKHVGGLNLFGENFGNHKQDLILHIKYY
jgi:predicted transcriptional regulator